MARYILVCGPPCSGKSTFIEQSAEPGDVVFRHDGFADDRRAIAYERSRFIRETRGLPVTAWIECCCPSASLLRSLPGCKIVQMDTPMSECLRRLDASDRSDKDRWRAIIAAAFQRDDLRVGMAPQTSRAW
jgi:dephospho-CoA kinase